MKFCLLIWLLVISGTSVAQDRPAEKVEDPGDFYRKACAKQDLEGCMALANHQFYSRDFGKFPAAGVKTLRKSCNAKRSEHGPCAALGKALQLVKRPDLKGASNALSIACGLADSTGIGIAQPSQATLGGSIPREPAACVAHKELECALGDEAMCKAWIHANRPNCQERCAHECDHIGLGGRSCCNQWTSDCEDAHKAAGEVLNKAKPTSTCAAPSRAVQIHVYINAHGKILWAGAHDSDDLDLSCQIEALKKFNVGKLRHPAAQRVRIDPAKVAPPE